MSYNKYQSLQIRLNSESNGFIKTFISQFVQESFFKDFISACLYPVEFNNNTIIIDTNNVNNTMKKFLNDLYNMNNSLKLSNSSQNKTYINLIKTILNIKENKSTIINYDNVLKHIPNMDLSSQTLIKSINKLNDSEEFKKITDHILKTIQTYYVILEIVEQGINLDNLLENMKTANRPVYEMTDEYKEIITSLYNTMANSSSFKQDNLKDYYIISNENSVIEISEELTRYISDNYSFFKTGYNIFDKYLEGIESGSVHMISAPSNAGKSMLLANLSKNIIVSNFEEWKPKDTILLVTLEDDVMKLTRRLISIFGNINQDSLRSLYRRSYECIKTVQDNNTNNILEKLKNIINKTLINSILSVTQSKVNLAIKHSSENIFSPNDLTKFIDRLRVEGYNVKVAIIDYLDVMSPSIYRTSFDNTYSIQGQITQELRNVSKNYKIPIITATQSIRAAEDEDYDQDNKSIGDSYLKVRYSDFIYFCRMYTRTKQVDDQSLINYLFPDDNSWSQNTKTSGRLKKEILDIIDNLKLELYPFEIKISKSKEGGRDNIEYQVFSKNNLRIYDTIPQYILDMSNLKKNTNSLDSEIRSLINLSILENNDIISEIDIEKELENLDI
jgi:replicative DNA helicase